MFSMYMPSERVLRAICWTLVHSCWQGMLLAILTGLVILLTRRSSPVMRYNLFALLLCLFFASTCITFVLELGSGVAVSGVSAGAVTGQVGSVGAMVAGIDHGADAATGIGGFWVVVQAYLNDHSSWIVAVWLLVLMVKAGRIMVQLGVVQRMRYYKVQAVEPGWAERLRIMAAELGIRRPVRLLESALVQAPMMAGMLKPVILIPLGLLSQLEPAQVEAILLHELAHIRRQDYFINLLFSFCEIFFFFNPAVLWLSALIREEREACCDDIAVAGTSNKRELIHALLFFQERAQVGLSVAPGFPGSGNHLLKRVRRIVYRDNKVLERREKYFLTLCLLVFCGLGLAFAGGRGHGGAKTAAGNLPAAGNLTMADLRLVDTLSPEARKAAWETLRKQQDSLETERKRLEEQGARLADAQQELSKQAQDLVQQQRGGGLRGIDSTELVRQKLFSQELMRQARITTDQAGMNNQQLLEMKLVAEAEAQRQQKNFQELRLTQLAKRDSMRLVLGPFRDSVRIHGDYTEMQTDTVRLEMTSRDLGILLAEENNRNLELQKLQAERAQQLALRQVDQLRLVRIDDEKGRGNAMEVVVEPIIEELKAMKLIENPERFTFSLDKNELKVNGVKQPAKIFEHFRDVYLKDPRNKYSYQKNGVSVMMSVEKH